MKLMLEPVMHTPAVLSRMCTLTLSDTSNTHRSITLGVCTSVFNEHDGLNVYKLDMSNSRHVRELFQEFGLK